MTEKKIEVQTFQLFVTSDGRRFDNENYAIVEEKEIFIKDHLPNLNLYHEDALKYILGYKKEIFEILMCGKIKDSNGNYIPIMDEKMKEYLFNNRHNYNLDDD